MARTALLSTGHFMGAKNEMEILEVMRNFIEFSKHFQLPHPENKETVQHNFFFREQGHSSLNSPIKLNKIKFSNCFGVEDGHHRISILADRGYTEVKALIMEEKTSYLQKLVLSGQQTHGDPELYQPLPQPELKDWPVVRKCRDRFKMMDDFLIQKKFKKNHLTLLDCSCSYGWFVNEFKKQGLTVLGIDKDIIPVQIGRSALGLKSNEIIQHELVDFLENNHRSFDIVLFLSILHHFAIGKEDGEVARILKRLDQITSQIIFIDTGQEHEKWNQERLAGWNDEYIIGTIRQHTSFTKVIKLGEDNDNSGVYRDQYRRSLFACSRN